MKVLKNKKLWVFVGIFAAVLLLNHYLGLGSKVEGLLEGLSDLALKNSVLAGATYVILTIVGVVILALPGVIFGIAAGMIFGPVWGTLLCSMATTLGAMGAFLVGRFFLKDTLEPIVRKNRYLDKWLFDQSGKKEQFLLMVTRLVPLFPYNLQNYAYGITGISFGMYSLESFLFMLPGTAIYTIGSAGITGGKNRFLYFGIAAVLAVVVMLIGNLLKKKYMPDDAEESSVSETARTEDSVEEKTHE